MHKMRLKLALVLWRLDFELYEKSLTWLEKKSYVLWSKSPLLRRISLIGRARLKTINYEGSRMITFRLSDVEGHICLSSVV